MRGWRHQLDSRSDKLSILNNIECWVEFDIGENEENKWSEIEGNWDAQIGTKLSWAEIRRTRITGHGDINECKQFDR